MLTGALRPRLLLALLPPTVRAIDWRPVLLGGLLSLASLWLWGDQPDLTADQLFERVEVAAMIFAAAVAFVLDDPAAALTASSVSPLALRRAARALLLAPIAVAWWACAVLLADAVHPPVAVPAAPVVVEQAALVALTLGFAAAGSWRVADRLGGVVAGPALLGVTGAAYFGLPPRLALFVDPMDPQVWLPARWRWLALLVAGLLLALAASRDPARRLGRRR